MSLGDGEYASRWVNTLSVLMSSFNKLAQSFQANRSQLISRHRRLVKTLARQVLSQGTLHNIHLA